MPAEEIIDRLRRVSDPPAGLVTLNEGPVIEFLKPMVPDLAAQLALRSVHRRIARHLERQPTIALARYPALVDFTAWIELRELADEPRREMDLRLRVRSTQRDADTDERIRVDDMNDLDALDAATSKAVAKLVEWIIKQQPAR